MMPEPQIWRRVKSNTAGISSRQGCAFPTPEAVSFEKNQKNNARPFSYNQLTNAAEVAALITDIRLPFEGPNGSDLAHRARELSPTIVVVYVRGDLAVEWASKGVPKSVMLAKPVAIAQLITAVSNLLMTLLHRGSENSSGSPQPPTL